MSAGHHQNRLSGCREMESFGKESVGWGVGLGGFGTGGGTKGRKILEGKHVGKGVQKNERAKKTSYSASQTDARMKWGSVGESP